MIYDKKIFQSTISRLISLYITNESFIRVFIIGLSKTVYTTYLSYKLYDTNYWWFLKNKIDFWFEENPCCMSTGTHGWNRNGAHNIIYDL